MGSFPCSGIRSHRLYPADDESPPVLGGVRRLDAQTRARFAYGDGRRSARLGDLVVGTLGVAADLKGDPGLGADLEALFVRDRFVDPLETRLAGHLAATGQAVEQPTLLGPGARQARSFDLAREAHGHLTAVAGPRDRLRRLNVGLRHPRPPSDPLK